MPDLPTLDDLNSKVVGCTLCPRLREWCLATASEKRAAYRDQEYWGLPVPHFGDPEAGGLIIGLAPAAHGANRTGRMFTGDRSGDWLYRAMHRAGLASQPNAEGREDGLALKGVLITAVAHCAPPDNKPLPQEVENCRAHLLAVAAFRPYRVVLCLGGLAFGQALKLWPPRLKGVKFGHGAEVETEGPLLLGSYHPSQQNTFTGRLTEAMLDDVMGRFARAISAP